MRNFERSHTSQKLNGFYKVIIQINLTHSFDSFFEFHLLYLGQEIISIELIVYVLVLKEKHFYFF